MTATPTAMYESPPVAGIRHIVLAIILGLAGGLLGIAGALFVEVRSSFSPAAPLLGAPIIEELLKPTGLYILIARWPFAVRRQLQIAVLTALSGLVFGLFESLTYVMLYVPHHSHAYLVFRFTVPVAIHVIASFTAGWGINEGLLDWARRGGAFPKPSRNAFAAAMALHATYNITVVILALTGTFDIK